MNRPYLSRFIKGIASRSVGTIFQVFIGILSLAIAVRFVPQHDFGVFVLLQVIASFFLIFNSLILQNVSITKFIAESPDNIKEEVVNTSIIVNIAIALTTIFIMFLFKPLVLFLFKTTDLSGFVIFIPLIYIIQAFDQLFQKIMQGFQQYLKMAISQIINVLVRILLIILFLIVFKMHLMGLLLAVIISFLCSLSYQYHAIDVKKRFRFRLGTYRDLFRFGFPLGLNDVLNFILLKTDRLMIGAMLNSTSVAYYEISSKIPEGSRNMFVPFIEVFFPSMVELFSKKNYSEAEKVLNHSLRIFAFLSLSFTLLLALFNREIVTILFSKEYVACAPALPLLMFALVINLMGNIMGTSLVALGQSDKPVKVSMLRAVVSVAANLMLIRYFGFMGAVYAALTSSIVGNPANLWFIEKTNVRINISQYIKPIIIFLICYIVLTASGTEFLLVKFLIFGMYVALCFAFAVIKKDDVHIIYRAIRTPLSALLHP